MYYRRLRNIIIGIVVLVVRHLSVSSFMLFINLGIFQIVAVAVSAVFCGIKFDQC